MIEWAVIAFLFGLVALAVVVVIFQAIGYSAVVGVEWGVWHCPDTWLARLWRKSLTLIHTIMKIHKRRLERGKGSEK